jgi:hypothetical protein
MTIERAPTRGKQIKVGQFRSTLVDLVNVTSYKFGVVYDPPIPCSTPGFMRAGEIHTGIWTLEVSANTFDEDLFRTLLNLPGYKSFDTITGIPVRPPTSLADLSAIDGELECVIGYRLKAEFKFCQETSEECLFFDEDDTCDH